MTEAINGLENQTNRQPLITHTHVSNWTSNRLEQWSQSIAYQLDEPAVLTLNEITAVRKDWSDESLKTRACLLLPTMYSAIIANLGVAIIYDEINRRNEGMILERCYFPEKKLLVRLKKEGMPLFSKENFMPLQNFDILGFSSFYPVQFLNIPTMLELGNVPVFEKDRDGTNAPIVVGGGVSFFNPEPVSDFMDAVFVGEAEGSFSKALRILEECKTEHGIDKERLLRRWAKETTFMYVPKFYDVKYFKGFGVKERKVKEEFVGIASESIKRATADLYNTKALTYTFVPVIGGGNMSVGSLEVARGCSAMCRFCEGAYRTYPYRERSYDSVKQAFDELIQNTGVKDVTPYSFNLSDFSAIRRLLAHLLTDQDKKISMSSQRIDMFDEGFARMAYLSGNRSITLAMEAGSQHMRNVINKNLTEEQILEAFESAFKIGFNKIKVYMIANLPFETEKDLDDEQDSTIAIMRKIAERRDYWAKRNGKKCQLTFSYTPFTSKNGTPFQWAECMGSLKNKRTLTKAVEEARRLGIKFRVGTSAEIAVIAQVLTLGDRRLNTVLYRAVKENVLSYFGGMSVGKDVLPAFEKLLKEETGHGYEDYMGEKKLNQVFPWDFIDLGTTKEFLKEQWLAAKEATAQEDTFGCFNRCSSCRACHTFADVLPSVVGKDFLVTSWHKVQSADEDSREFVDIISKAKKPNTQKYKIKISVNQELRYLDRNKIKLYLNRAYIRTGFPARQTMNLASDKIRYQNWSYGTDYVSGFLHEKLVDTTRAEWAEKLNNELKDFGVQALQVEFFSSELKDDQTYEFVLYETATDFDQSKVAAAIEKFKGLKELVVKIKVPGKDKGLWETIDIDVLPFIGDIWYDTVKGSTVIRCTMSEMIGPYEVFPTLFETSQKAIKRFPVKRIEYLKKTNEFELDMFANTCEISGAQIETNIFDQPVSEHFCIRQMPFDGGTVVIGKATSDEELAALQVEAETVAPDADESVELNMQDAANSDTWDGIQ